MKLLFTLTFIFSFQQTCFGAPHMASRFEVLSPTRLMQLEKEPCTFVHVWATWCTSCVQELPGLLKKLSQLKNVNPVIIDLSTPFVQESFSKRYLRKLAPTFKTFFKPEIKDSTYMSALEKNWTGELPYSAVFNDGIKKKVWKGNVNPSTLTAELGKVCQR